MSAVPQTIHRADYCPPALLVNAVSLRVELDPHRTRVESELDCSHTTPGAAVHLPGQALRLLHVRIDDAELPADAWQFDEDGLTLADVPERCRITIVTEIDPTANTALEGLYRSGGLYCTQCEAEGFRRITCFPDRPDVMAVYTVTVVADQASCPVLLSNGNLVAEGQLEDGRHWARWHDPHPKPCYLFALVAGDLACHEDRFHTRTGRDVRLQLFVEHHNVGKTDHAMESLKLAMAWDERRYGLSYDLDRYMIVAVDHFNMGAMENKGLNVFNTNCVLADAQTTTDQDFDTVKAVIAHEYFHNWTGNRVTCRDWFQLSLTEGLTVFREQQFCEDHGSPDVERIQQVRVLRAAQFPEDAGPTAHPVRPDTYIEISNFYTPTVYNKGAEVIRMLVSLLGEQGFRKGMDLYFERHDGQAVTCDDFVAAMADANDTDLTQFSRWYSQIGTPVLHITDAYDAVTQRYTLNVRQACPPGSGQHGQADQPPLHLPLRMGLLGQDGTPLPLQIDGQPSETPGADCTLAIREHEQSFTFKGIPERPIPSLLRGFSAPVRLEQSADDATLALLLRHDQDGFARWEAGQRLATRLLLQGIARADSQATSHSDPEPVANSLLIDALRGVIERADEDPAFAAEALTLPGTAYLAEQLPRVDMDVVHAVREQLLGEVNAALLPELTALYQRFHDGSEARDPMATGRRALANCALGLLARSAGDEHRLLAHLDQANSMSDRLCALALLVNIGGAAAETALADFHQRWQHESLVINKWFQVQAMSTHPQTPETVATLREHPDFDIRNPNRVRAVIGAFAHGNPLRFHRADGAGYRLLADSVLQLDAINPQVAARCLLPLTRWQRQEPVRQALMQTELERIEKHPRLSRDVYEVVSKGLQKQQH